MRRVLAACLFTTTCLYTLQLSAAPDAAKPAPAQSTCGPSCAPASLAKPLEYSQQIARGGEFRADIAIHQPCSCTRPLNLLLAFTPLGANSSREQNVKVEVAQGTATTHIVWSSAELAKAKITPGQYTIGFSLRDEHDAPLGAADSGHPFTFGTSKETLSTKPVVPAAIGRDSELAVPFVFENAGDIPARVTALLVFTRPDKSNGIEFYTPNLIVAPRGSKHVVRLTAAKRKALQVGAGPWLVTTAAFDGGDNRLAFFPGSLMMIGKTLSQPTPPKVSTPIGKDQDLNLTLTFKNEGDSDDLVTALLLFSTPGNPKPIEYKLEGLQLPVGTSTHPIVLSPLDRYNLGIKPGHWRVAASALDRANKRLEVQRGNDLVIETAAEITAK